MLHRHLSNGYRSRWCWWDGVVQSRRVIQRSRIYGIRRLSGLYIEVVVSITVLARRSPGTTSADLLLAPTRRVPRLDLVRMQLLLLRLHWLLPLLLLQLKLLHIVLMMLRTLKASIFAQMVHWQDARMQISGCS